LDHRRRLSRMTDDRDPRCAGSFRYVSRDRLFMSTYDHAFKPMRRFNDYTAYLNITVSIRNLGHKAITVFR
jgi:hypothetical protein